MGKDLRGKELGVGISQLKDGRYTARFTAKSGKRVQKYFGKLQECRKWMAEAQYQDETGTVMFANTPTVDAWFDYWLNEVKGNSIRPSTKNAYERFWRNASRFIGDFKLSDVKPIHCQKVLNVLKNNGCKTEYIKKLRFLMSSSFECAVDNGFIPKNPVVKSVTAAGGKKSEIKEALTIDEQRQFLKGAKASVYYNEYALILQTGLRVGELIALKWSDIDFKNKKMRVQRSAYNLCGQGLVLGEPKTESGFREIPLTTESIKILKAQKEKNSTNKIIPIQNLDFVFINSKGKLNQSSAYNIGIRIICDREEMQRFSVHVLRHTFATRCIESGMRPKTLQSILGHSNIEMTMNRYVHVTDETKTEEMELIEQKLKLV